MMPIFMSRPFLLYPVRGVARASHRPKHSKASYTKPPLLDLSISPSLDSNPATELPTCARTPLRLKEPGAYPPPGQWAPQKWRLGSGPLLTLAEGEFKHPGILTAYLGARLVSGT
jgi:hypothetical protein